VLQNERGEQTLGWQGYESLERKRLLDLEQKAGLRTSDSYPCQRASVPRSFCSTLMEEQAEMVRLLQQTADATEESGDRRQIGQLVVQQVREGPGGAPARELPSLA